MLIAFIISCFRAYPTMLGATLLALLLGACAAQQPEQAHLSLTGKLGELSLDFMAHTANCSAGWGVQLAPSPDFSEANFIPASNCTDFTAFESAPTFAVRTLLTGLVTRRTTPR